MNGRCAGGYCDTDDEGIHSDDGAFRRESGKQTPYWVGQRSAAELLTSLLSDRAAFMTGAIAAMDGGLTASGYYSLDGME